MKKNPIVRGKKTARFNIELIPRVDQDIEVNGGGDEKNA